MYVEQLLVALVHRMADHLDFVDLPRLYSLLGEEVDNARLRLFQAKDSTIALILELEPRTIDGPSVHVVADELQKRHVHFKCPQTEYGMADGVRYNCALHTRCRGIAQLDTVAGEGLIGAVRE